MIIFISGGARSGKSGLAEKIAHQRQKELEGDVYYLATASAGDDEMSSRIAAHRERRPDSWLTVEEELNPAGPLRELAQPEGLSRKDTLILDCITLLISNHIGAVSDSGEITAEEGELTERIIDSLHNLTDISQDKNAALIMVANEVGLGVVPPSSLGRLFRDVAGRINRRMEQMADKSYFMISGRPVNLEEISASPLTGDEIL